MRRQPLRLCGVLIVLLLTACTSEARPGLETGHLMGNAHVDLKLEQFPERFDLSPAAPNMGCAERLLGTERAGDDWILYLRIMCGRWSDGACAAGTRPDLGLSSPAVARVRGDDVRRWQFPGDGSQYKRDIDAWFPKDLREQALSPSNDDVSALEAEARRDAGCRHQ